MTATPTKQARYRRNQSAEKAEIGPPQLTAAQREEGQRLWAMCKGNLEAFNTLAFPFSTGLKPLGTVQRESITHDQSVIVHGGRVCKAEPRGYGKTTRCCNAAIWGVLSGNLEMVPVFSANLEKSKNQIMARWKTELLNNDILFWMHPELIWPFRALGNKPQGAPSQTFNGELTHIKWTADRIVFPHIPGIVGSGAALIALPLKSCRGATHTTPDGTVLRPDLCVFDDVQNDEDADNPATVQKLAELIDHTALMLGGHSQTMSAIMNCTVRQVDDLSETYLKKPGWRRVRYKMLAKPSKVEESFWLGEYAKVRNDYDPEDPDDQKRAQLESLRLYESRRAEADEGAEATWDWAYTWRDNDPLEISAVQHAYNIWIDIGASVFASECQNAPIVEKVEDDELRLCPKEIVKKVNNIARGELPLPASQVFAFIDPKKDVLFWTVVAFGAGFTGWVCDYGTFPDQKREYFNSRKLRVGLQAMMNASSWEAGLYAGLDAVVNQLAAREWKRDDGAVMKIDQILIDHGWGDATETIDLFCRQSAHASILVPSKGIACLAKHGPFNDRDPKQGEERQKDKRGAWRRMPAAGKHAVRPIRFDTNWFKTFVASRFKTPMGGSGCLSLFGSDPAAHKLFAEHCSSEKPQAVESGQRRILEWGRPGVGQDNDYWDCLIGCHVAAAMRGMTLHEQIQTPQRFVSLSDMKKAAKHWDPKQKKWAAKSVI